MKDIETAPATLRNENPKAGDSKFLTAWEISSPSLWPEIFLISCVIGVLIDPLFLYIPVINENNKCLRRDEKMMKIALVLRSITDFGYVLHIIVRYQRASKMAEAFGTSIKKKFPWFYLLIDILAILPVPQVIVLVFFSKMAGSLTTRKILNVLLLAQYVPRIIRIYVSAKELAKDYNPLTRFVWVRGVFNLCLYFIAGHVLGALWYFYSIFRETACWHHACKSVDGCNFDCHIKFTQTKNVTYFNEICPVNPPNEKVYDFGIFAKAMESGILETTNFPRKLCKCFWWGLQNLSSFGSNLQTSGDVWENFLAIVISILGLVLFLYLIGNLQTYLQILTTKSEEERQKVRDKFPEIDLYLSKGKLSKSTEKFVIKYVRRTIMQGKDPDVDNLFHLLKKNEDREQNTRLQNNTEGFTLQSFTECLKKICEKEKHKLDMFERSAEWWIYTNKIPSDSDMEKHVMQYVKLRLREGNKEVDLVNILHILPPTLRMCIKKHLCLNILMKVPMLQSICSKENPTLYTYLKPVIYPENTYIIRKGEPIDMMLFITQGIVWSFNKTSMECLRKGDYFGKELLEWKSKESTSYSDFPKSTNTVKAHTKVEAFTLTAANLESMKIFLFTKVQRWYHKKKQAT